MDGFVFHPLVLWDAGDEWHPARVASWRAMNALAEKDKDAFVSLYAPTGGIMHPIGPSMFGQDGNGYYGRDKLSLFWDDMIEPVKAFAFRMTDSFATGNEVANTGTVTTLLDGGRVMNTEGVFQYRVDSHGRLESVRAFWELDRAMKTIRTVRAR